MDAAVIRAITEALQQPWGRDEVIIVPPGWKELRPDFDVPETLHVSTLLGVRNYVKTNIDMHAFNELMVLVESPTSVMLCGKVHPSTEGFRRFTWMGAEAEETEGFGEYQPADRFTVWLMTQFVPTPERDELLALVASIRENSVRETVDDGVAQEVKTGRGIKLVGMQKVPSPVLLKPYRTFPEIEQPSSPFVLRLRTSTSGNDRPELALIEADGGAWKVDAINRIGEYFTTHLPEVGVVY